MTGVLVQGLCLMELPYKPAVTTSMVVDWVVLVLELHISKVTLKDVYSVLSVSLDLTIKYLYTHFYPARACAARGKVISRGWWVVVSINLQFFWNQSLISQNTHFQSSISTQIGFSSNLMASGIA